MNKIDWEKIWNDFDVWYCKQVEPQKCTKCKRNHYDDPEWDTQQNKIKRLVNAQIQKVIEKMGPVIWSPVDQKLKKLDG